MESQSKPTAIGVYIFAGGFTVGVREHFDVLAHFEDGPFGVTTAMRNFPELEVHTDPRTWPVDKFAGVNLIYANPPCAPWSMANAKPYHAWKTDDRVACVKNVLGLLSRIKPDVWCFESVRNVFSKGRDLIDDLTREANALGYAVSYVMVEAGEHGVPQRRPRFFMVAHRVQIPWVAAQGPAGLVVGDVLDEDYAQVDHLDVTMPVEARFRPLLEHTEQGKKLRNVWERLNADAGIEPEYVAHGKTMKIKGRPSFLQGRLDASKASPTLTGSATKFNPWHDRYISIDESKKLSGYPDAFKFEGTVNNQYAQIAKGLMPPVADWLAGCFANGIRNGVGIESDSVCMVTVTAAGVWIDKMPQPVAVVEPEPISVEPIEDVKPRPVLRKKKRLRCRKKLLKRVVMT